MKFQWKFAAAALVAALFVVTPVFADDDDPDVVVLTKDSFKSALADNENILVEFYAPWCGHCKKLKPEYAKAATELKGSEFVLAKVDCTVETDICSEQGVQGYPTLKFFRKGKAKPYEKARTAEAIVDYLKKQVLPSVNVQKTKDEVASFVDSQKVVVMGYFEKEDSKGYKAFSDVADQLRDDFVFGVAFGKDLAKGQGEKVPAIVLYKKFDDKKNVFPQNVDSKEMTEDAITKFVKINAVPLMNDIGPENYGSYMESGLPLAYLFVADEDQRTTYGAMLEPLAKKYRGKVNFVYIDAVQFGGHANNLNLKEEWPAFAIQETKGNAKYPFKQGQEMTEESLATFVESFTEGNLQPDIKSDEIPESNDGPVKVVVSKQFVELVMDKEKDVLIEFYAPWCGHCKKLAPIYEELGKKISKDSNIVIAKMDATTNDLPPEAGFTIEGFPTSKLFKAESNEVVDYDGDRTLDGFIKFLRENAANKDFELSEETEDKEEETKDEEHDEL